MRIFMTTLVTNITIFAFVTKVTSGAKVTLPIKVSLIPVVTNPTIVQWLLWSRECSSSVPQKYKLITAWNISEIQVYYFLWAIRCIFVMLPPSI